MHKKLKFFPISSESGFNLIESLVAMIVVSILLVAIGPVIAYSVGVRVQSKRIDLAAQASRAYVDAVRAGSVASPTPGSTKHELIAAPSTGSLTCDASKLCTVPTAPANSTLYCVDFDGDGKCTVGSVTDMVVQGSAYNPNSTDSKQGYLLGVRVYRANSFNSEVTLKQPTAANPLTSDSVSTNALGNRSLPLFQTTTEIAPAGEDSLENIRDRLCTTPPC